MRIALVSMHTSPAAVPGSGDAGGMNVVVREAARALGARGHEVVVATRASAAVAPGEYPLFTSDTGNGVHPPRLVAIEAGAPGLRKGALPAVVGDFAVGLAGLGPFDAVHAHYWLSGLAASEAARAQANAGRIALTFHTLAAQKNAHLAPGDAPEPMERVAAERALAASAFVVAGSRSELSGVEEYCGEPRVGAEIVHPGVDTRLFRPAVSPARGPLRITVLGRVQPLKGQDLAISVAAVMSERDPELFSRTEWVIAGEPTPGAEGYADDLREAANRAGIAHRVRFLPAQTRDEAAALLASSALVLVPSHSETFGLTALEAAACGVPVIAAGHTGLLEAVSAGRSGVHVAGREPAEWADAVGRILRDDHARQSLGASARLHAERHDWRAHAAKLERIYERLVG